MAFVLKIKKSYMAFVAFFLIYVLDFFSYGVFNDFNIPIGMVGLIIGFLLIPFFVNQKSVSVYSQIVIALLLLLPIILAYTSGRGGITDVYFWFRALGLFVIGYYFTVFLEQPATKLELVLTVSILLLSSYLTILTEASKGENYLRTSDSLVMLSFLIIASVRNIVFYTVLAIVTIASLYFINSRFGLVAYTISVSALFYSRFGLVEKAYLIFLSIPVVFVVYQHLYNAYLAVDNIHNSRLLRLIFESDNDTSLQGRNSMLENAFSVFKKNPVFGDYKYYLDEGTPGAYAHNFMSFWSELGVLGVIISLFFIYVASKALVISYRGVKSGKRLYSFLFLLSVYLILGILLAKSYDWSSLYFIAGLCYCFLYGTKGSNSLSH